MQPNQPRTKKDLFPLTLCATMSAMAIVMALLIRFSVFPAVSFLEYDAGDIPIFLLSMLLGPIWASGASIVTALIQGVTVSAGAGIIGILMNILSTCSFVWGMALVKVFIKRTHIGDFAKQSIASLGGLCATVATMTLWNLLITPFYMGVPRQMVLDLLGWIVLFNAVKTAINGVLSLLLWRGVTPFLNEKKR